MNRRHVVVALGLTFALGCNEFQAAVEEAVADSEAPTVQPAPQAVGTEVQAPSSELLLASKLARYAECLHRTRPLVVASEAVWRSSVAETGTPVSRRVPPSVRTVSDLRNACGSIDRDGATLEPPLPKLEGAVASYVDALRQVGLHTTSLGAYYQSRGYADDDWALGKSLAPTLESAFGRFDRAAVALGAALDTQAYAVDRALLAQVHAREGKSARWHAHATMIAARTWVRCIVPPSSPRRRAAPVPPVQTESCDVAMSGLVAATNGLVARRAAHPDEASGVFWMTSFAHSAQQLRGLAETLHAGPPAEPTGRSKKKRKKKKKNAAAKKPPRSRIQPAFDALVLDYGQLGW